MKKTAGFTLIELLIVIAIIGILAAVLIPNLLNARKVASERAAQAYSANVYKAAVAYIAENPSNTLVTSGCGPTSVYTAGAYTVPKPGNPVASCTISGDVNAPVVAVVSQAGTTFTNGSAP